MIRTIFTVLLQVALVSPLLFWARAEKGMRWKNLLLLVAFLGIYWTLLSLPNSFPALKMTSGSWNWSGKIYAIAGSALFYFAVRSALGTQDFVRFEWRNQAAFRKFLIILAFFVCIIGLAFYLISDSTDRTEYLRFQALLPGLDEELAFRGIIMGLLSAILKPEITLGRIKLGNPALWISAAFFALGHSFTIDSQWNVHQNWFEFLNVLAIGSLLGWLTLKSGNIWTAVLVHNLFNVVPKLLFWL